MEITIESLKQAYPDLISKLEREAFNKGYSEGMAKGAEDGFKSGAESERVRIKAVEESALPGHEELIASLKYDGKTTGEQAAVKVLQAEKALRETRLSEYKADTPPVVVTVDATGKEEKIDGKLSLEERAKKAWDKDEALRAEFGNDFEAYKSYEEATETGLVKIYNKK